MTNSAVMYVTSDMSEKFLYDDHMSIEQPCCITLPSILSVEVLFLSSWRQILLDPKSYTIKTKLQNCYMCKEYVYSSKSLSYNIFSFPTQKELLLYQWKPKTWVFYHCNSSVSAQDEYIERNTGDHIHIIFKWNIYFICFVLVIAYFVD